VYIAGLTQHGIEKSCNIFYHQWNAIQFYLNRLWIMSISIPNFIKYFPNFIYITVWFLNIKKEGSMIEERKGAALAGNVVAKGLKRWGHLFTPLWPLFKQTMKIICLVTIKYKLLYMWSPLKPLVREKTRPCLVTRWINLSGHFSLLKWKWTVLIHLTLFT